MRAKRATFTFWVAKSWLKMPKIVHFDEILKAWSLWSNSVTRHAIFNRPKTGEKCHNSEIQIQHFWQFLSYRVFENKPKCLIWISEFWHFPPIFVLLKLTCLVTLFDQVFKKLAKLTIFDQFLSKKYWIWICNFGIFHQFMSYLKWPVW